MSNKLHGVVSISLIGISILIGVVGITLVSIPITIIYLLLIVPLVLLIVYSYCGKCTCKDYSCGHIIPGKITKILPKRIKGKYSSLDYLGVFLPLLILVAFPQFWLIKTKVLLIAFWVLLLVASIDILLFVCTSCKNENCSLCKIKKV